jgi:hypothetical protein
MKRIEMDKWEPVSEKPRTVRYAGQRTAQEVFVELKHRLESTGYLPDEYFLMNSHWENGREIPRDAAIFCTTDYGASEGIYLDIYLKWHDAEQKKSITMNLATGKTLGETGLDLDRMNLIASAVTKAFHSDGVHARYVRLGEPEQSDGCIMHLNGAERRLLIDSLVDKRFRLTQEGHNTEQLLRRVTGSITEYINETGQRPMNMSYYDEAVLAIHDGNLPSFNEVYRNAEEQYPELLQHAAGRPGNIGRQMTGQILAASASQGIPSDIYLNACKKAVGTGDTERVLSMLIHADSNDMDKSIHGDTLSHAMSEHKQHIAREILKHCPPEHIEAANPRVLVQALDRQDYSMARDLVEKGIDANKCAAEIIHALTYRGNDRGYFDILLKRGMNIDNGNYSAMQSCIRTESPEQAKLLLDRGMDFDLYTQWIESDCHTVKDGETHDAVRDYWENTIKQADSEITEDSQGQAMGGM